EKYTLPSDKSTNCGDQFYISESHCLAGKFAVSGPSVELDHLCKRDRFTRRHDSINVEAQIEILEMVPVKYHFICPQEYFIRLPEKVFVPGKWFPVNQDSRFAIGSDFETEPGRVTQGNLVTPEHEFSHFGHKVKDERSG